MMEDGLTKRLRPLKLIYDAVCAANRDSLERSLAGSPQESHSEMIAEFERHMSGIACFCHDSYLGAGTLTTAFIRELHRRHYPAGCREVPCVPDGEALRVASDMQALVDDVNAALTGSGSDQYRRDCVILFGRNLVRIRPFADANERLASILVDVLLIRAGMAPIRRKDLVGQNGRASIASYGSLMATSLD